MPTRKFPSLEPFFCIIRSSAGYRNAIGSYRQLSRGQKRWLLLAAIGGYSAGKTNTFGLFGSRTQHVHRPPLSTVNNRQRRIGRCSIINCSLVDTLARQTTIIWIHTAGRAMGRLDTAGVDSLDGCVDIVDLLGEELSKASNDSNSQMFSRHARKSASQNLEGGNLACSG